MHAADDKVTQLEVAARLKYAQSTEIGPVLQECVELGKQLYALRNALLNRP